MSSRALISVIVPTFCRPQLLERCVQALLDQQFDPNLYEILIVTDGPDEATNLLVRRWAAGGKHHLHCLSLPIKKGPAAARNFGWNAASGKLMLFTDDDCLPDPNWLSAFWHAYRGQRLAAFTGKVIVPIGSFPTDFEKNTKGLEDAEFITANCACTKEALSLVDGFDENFTMAWREDSDLHFKLLLYNVPIRKVQEAVVKHPVRSARWGVSMKEQKKGMFNALLYKKHPRLYRQKIQRGIAWDYIIIVVGLTGAVVCFVAKERMIASVLLAAWFYLTLRFLKRRLAGASRSPAHVGEMLVTSLAIPFLSIYWQLYGSVKYRVLFL